MVNAGPHTSEIRTVSHYRILGKLGAGGMGVVYKAEDLRLGRTVALKFLSEELLNDKQSFARFEREARAISALSHPNICVLHEISEDGGQPFLVMEYLSGETLAQRLEKGAVPLDEALEIGAGIASALDAAHRHGIVHRDLKPGNVILTATGPKLLDFGLAKLKRGGEIDDFATMTATLTRRGVIVGTLPYMAPEQLDGKRVDARTDLWALGATLYEMITGKPPFTATSQASLVAAILEHEPPALGTLAPLTPPLLDHIINRCLAKNPDRRWDSARVVADQLEWIRIRGSEGSREGDSPTRTHNWRSLAIAMACIAFLALLAAAFGAWSSRSHPARQPSMRLTLTLPDSAPLASPGVMSAGHDRPALALSPDGSRLAYVAVLVNGPQICIRDMETGKVLPVPDTENGNTPFFSPDGDSVGFFADSKLKRVSLAGGGAMTLADAPNPWGATWGQDGFIYFSRTEAEGIFRVAAEGGVIEPVARGQSFAIMPELLGPGRRLLAVRLRNTDLFEGEASPRTVLNGFGARYVPTGHLLYAQQGKLKVIPFDRTRGRASGNPVSLDENLRTAFFGVAQFAVAPNGTLVYATGGSQLMSSFVWVDRTGKTRDMGLPEALNSPFSISPDGKRVAFVVEDGGGDTGSEVWIYEIQTGARFRLSPRVASGPPVHNLYPVWTPDSKDVIFARQTESRWQLIQETIGGVPKETVLWSAAPEGPVRFTPVSFSPDGSILSAYTLNPERSFDLWLLPLKSADRAEIGRPKLFLANRFAESFGQISPDGRWMLYASDESGRYEIYVTSYPKAGAVYRISRNGGQEPKWNRNGREIVYFDAPRMYAVDVTLAPDFKSDEPRLLFEGPFPDFPGFSYDLAPDGQHFLMLEKKDFFKPTTTLQVITNIFDELQRRAPARK